MVTSTKILIVAAVVNALLVVASFVYFESMRTAHEKVINNQGQAISQIIDLINRATGATSTPAVGQRG